MMKPSRRKIASRQTGLKASLVVLLALGVVWSAVGTASAQEEWFGKNKVQYKLFHWNVLVTPHFDIHFTDGYRGLAARTGVILEHGYDKLAKDFSHQVMWRVPVIVYGSHSDFEQTNVASDLLPEAVQAFTEPLRKRMVLQYGGLDDDYVHTAVHELVHIFTFDIVYGSLLRSVFSRNFLFPIPLWFAEGLAEYYSVGFDGMAEMFMRDATVFDYLPDLDQADGYMAYKAGQAAIFYLNETYGPGKVNEIMDHLRNQRGSISLALQSSVGLSSTELSRDWQKAMRRRFWPLYADKKEAEFYGRRLTDHMKQHHFLNSKPVFSPDGEHILFYSDRKGLDGIYLMNSLTGKIEKKLLIGSLSTRFETIRSMNSNLSWSPDGSRIAFVAKSHGRDKLFVMSVAKAKVLREIALPLDFFMSPGWSPKEDKIVVVGTLKGQTDLFLYDLGSEAFSRLTNDGEDEENPTWFPDGQSVAYVRYPMPAAQPVFLPDSAGVERMSGVDLRAESNVHVTDSDIWAVDLADGQKRLLISTPGNDNDQVILAGGTEILFTSDESGVKNLYRGSIEVGSYYRFTDVLGGIYSSSVSTAKDRLVFSAFNSAGFDLFIMEQFSEKSKMSYSTGSPLIAELKGKPALAESLGVAPPAARPDTSGMAKPDTTKRTQPDTTATAGPDTLRAVVGAAAGGGGGKKLTGSLHGEFTRTGGVPSQTGLPRDEYSQTNPPPVVVDQDSQEDVNPDTLAAIRRRMEKEVGTVQPYHRKLAPDYIGQGGGLGVYYSTGFGFLLSNQIALSDLLGDHHIVVAFDLFHSLADSDFLVAYYYLRQRIDYAVGLFQFKNYLNSRVSSIGEAFVDFRLFTERNYGAYASVSYPFSTFTRAELEFDAYVSKREFFQTTNSDAFNQGFFFTSSKSQRRLFQPTFSLIHDSAYYGLFGPVIGSRWMLSASRAFSFSGTDVSRSTVFADYRKYTPLFFRNYFAFRAIGASSTGNDPRFFFLGGPTTLRGYDYLQFSGPKIVLFNAEYRYPLVDALIFGWPGRWGFTNIGGTLFLDSGATWGRGSFVEPLRDEIGFRQIRVDKQNIQFYSDFGVGFYMRFAYFILNFQLGWPTDFANTGRPFFHFYIGPQF